MPNTKSDWAKIIVTALLAGSATALAGVIQTSAKLGGMTTSVTSHEKRLDKCESNLQNVSASLGAIQQDISTLLERSKHWEKKP